MQSVEVIYRLVDKMTVPMQDIAKMVNRLEVTIEKEMNRSTQQFEHLSSSISKTASNAKRNFKGMQDGMSSMSKNFVKSSLQIVGSMVALDKAKNVLVGFDDARARVVGLAGLKGKDVQTLTDSALKIGGSTEFDATDVMNAFAVNARMIKDVKTLQEVTAVQTDLATLGQTTITNIAQNSSTLVTILGLNGKEMIKFGDSVAYMMSKNDKSIVSNLEALTEAAPLLKQYGNDFNDAVALVGVAPSIQTASGSELGTAFRSMITEGLANTVRLASKGNVEKLNVVKNLGLSPDDLDLSKHKLIDVLETISDAQKKGGKMDSHGLFGSFGMGLGAALVKDIDKLKQARTEAENVKGKLGEMSAPMRKTIGANLGNALGAVEALMVKMGDSGLTASIISVANAFEKFVNFLADSPAIVSTITTIGLLTLKLWAVGRIVVLLKSMFLALRVPLLIFRTAAVLAGGVLPALAAGFAALFTSIRVAMTANPLGALVTGLMLGYEALNLLYKLWKKFKGEQEGEKPAGSQTASQSKQSAYWQTSDGKMIPYTPQSKQKITTDININLGGNVPEGTKAEAVQRGTSGVDLGTTSILKAMVKNYGF